MQISTKIASTVSQSDISTPLITLLTIDATMIEKTLVDDAGQPILDADGNVQMVNAGLWHFTPNRDAQTGVLVFGQEAFLPLAFELKGWEADGSGTQPQPQLVLANTEGILRGAINNWEDLVGARVTIVWTFADCLDNALEDPDEWGIHYFNKMDLEIAQKTSETPEGITWKLRTFIDRLGAMFPRRQILREGGNPDFTLTAPAVSRYRKQ